MLKLRDIKKIMAESSLSCVNRGPDLSQSKDHLLVYHPKTVDEKTDKDLRRTGTVNDRVLWFGVSESYCFLQIDKLPSPHIHALRLWTIPLYEDRSILLARINRLNRETTFQKITVSEKTTKWRLSEDQGIPAAKGTISIYAPIPENGLTYRDIETITMRLLAVPVEEKLTARKPQRGGKKNSQRTNDDQSVAFDKEGNFKIVTARKRKPKNGGDDGPISKKNLLIK